MEKTDSVSPFEAGHCGKPTAGGGYRFGTDAALCADELRRFADAMNAGRVCLQKVETTQQAKVEEFVMRKITIEYAYRETAPPTDTEIAAALAEAGAGTVVDRDKSQEG